MNLNESHAEIADELDAVWQEVVATGRFVGGPLVARFEQDWAAACARRHAVGVANGTDALTLTLRALSIGPGDEVILPANTFVATAEAVALVGATPRFVDVDPDTLLVTPAQLKASIGPRSAAVIVVHLYGQIPPMDELLEVAEDAGLALIEDAAQAHGATWNGRPAGCFGVAACFSFYPGKNLGALGDGGAVVTDDAELAAKIRSLGDHGRSNTSKHQHVAVGTNSRLDALQAGVLSVKLRSLHTWNDRRRASAARYAQALAGGPATPVGSVPHSRSAYHLYVVRVPHRAAVAQELAQLGIQTGVHYPIPCHRTAAFLPYAEEALPVCEAAATQILSLPMSPHMTVGQVDRVAEVLLESCGVSVG